MLHKLISVLLYVIKKMMDEKYKFEIPMSLYDINNTLGKNLILENRVDIIKQKK